MDEVVDEGGDEHRLAGAGEAGDAEAHGRRADGGGAFGEIGKDEAGLVRDGGQLHAALPGRWW